MIECCALPCCAVCSYLSLSLALAFAHSFSYSTSPCPSLSSKGACIGAHYKLFQVMTRILGLRCTRPTFSLHSEGCGEGLGEWLLLATLTQLFEAEQRAESKAARLGSLIPFTRCRRRLLLSALSLAVNHNLAS